MKIINQHWRWIKKPKDALKIIEVAGRTCYKSERGITKSSSENFSKMLLSRGHESVIEHSIASVKFVTNRGVTHELVRHRLASYSQESTRYVKYAGDIEFIRPVWWNEWSEPEKKSWKNAMRIAEENYQSLLSQGSRPEQAREVLPNSLKTEIVMTANLREWRHVFQLRCDLAAHPQMRDLMKNCLKGFIKEVPVVFDDIGIKVFNSN
jgi:thymidylate synthase (FAD)